MRAALALAVVAAAVAAFALAGGDEGRERRQAPAAAPNLLVVMTDDQALGTFTHETMSETRAFFGDGTFFKQAISDPPLCCPARAGFLTGRYAHNHGVVENEVGYESMAGKEETLAVALQAGGYRTGMVGKFLNGYERVAGAEPAPGFDRWYAFNGPAHYSGYRVSDGGELREAEGYATEDLTREAIDFTREASGDGTPFFLWLAYNAPHTAPGGNPPPCNGEAAQPPDAATFDRFAAAPLPQPESFDEEDIADKPALGGRPAPLKPREIQQTTRAWRCGLAALASVDEQLHRLLSSLKESGELENTVVVYLSDNGYYFGEHRLTFEKRLPLEPALRIPFAIRVGDRVRTEAQPPAVDELVSQVDLAPTLLDYAGVEPCPEGLDCPPMDGRSLRGLLEGRASWPGGRALPLTLDEGWTYRALRTSGALLAEYTATRQGELKEPAVELYDLIRDPDQLENVAGDPEYADRVAELSVRLDRLSRCSGPDCE